MTADIPPDIRQILNELDAAERDAKALVDGLSEREGTTPPDESSWSVAHCLDHLATANRVYLAPMVAAAARGRQRGSRRRGPATPGFFGGLFARSLEPPPRTITKRRAPKKIRPSASPPLADAIQAFLASQREVRAFVHSNADLDLAHLRFSNPFVRGLFFSLATGLHVITAHERRHLWQGWRVRRSVEQRANVRA